MQNMYDDYGYDFSSYKPEKLNYTGNSSLKSNLGSSGSYLTDALASFGTGFLGGRNLNSYKPFYYVDSDYIGNGLAKTRLGSADFNEGMFKNANMNNPTSALRGIIGMSRANKYKLGNVNEASLVSRIKNLFADRAQPIDLGTRDTIEYGYNTHPYMDYLGTDTARQLDNIYGVNYMPNSIYGNWGKPNNYKGNFDIYFG